jgi:hypothetical protein
MGGDGDIKTIRKKKYSKLSRSALVRTEVQKTARPLDTSTCDCNLMFSALAKR